MSDGVEPRAVPASSRQLIAAALLTLAGAVALAFAPEAWPEAGVVTSLLLAVGLLFAERPASNGAILVGFGLLALNVGVSLAPGRTAVAATRLALPLAAFALARAAPAGRRRTTLWVLAGVGGVLGLVALLQKTVLLRWQADQLREAGGPSAFVDRLDLGRPYATQILPAALAGALTLALAASGPLIAAAGRRRPRGALALAAALAAASVTGLVLTGSVGALVGVLAGAGVVLAPFARQWSWRRWSVMALVFVVLTGALVAARPGGELWPSSPDHPLRLRAANWRGAVLVGLERPATGVGLGGFGALYDHFRRPGEVATIYAHNSWLQLAAEGGLPAVALLFAGAWALARRARAPLSIEQRWALAGGVAFAGHNLVDFTAYLPGVSVAGAILLGFAFGRTADTRDAAPAERGGAGSWARVGAVVFAAALVLVGAAYVAEAAARRPLLRAQTAGAASGPAERKALALDAVDATRLTPWDPIIAASAARAALGAGEPESARQLSERLLALDPGSPTSWRLAGDSAWALLHPTVAWRHWRVALLRRPADEDLAHIVRGAENQFRAAGLLKGALDYGEATLRPRRFGWETWNWLLLGVHLVALGWIVRRWWAPAGAPASALALAVVLLAAAWGEGGALPGPRLGRQLLIGAALLAALWPRRRAAPPWRPFAAPAVPLLVLAPGALWAALSAATAVDGAAARDGLVALLGSLAFLILSWWLARESPGWPEIVLRVFVVSAALAATLVLVQRVGLALGFDMATAPVPLRADPRRPAGDFLHPGALGAHLVAAGLALTAVLLAGLARRPRPNRAGLNRVALGFAAAAALLAVGFAGGARASLVSLVAAGPVLLFVAPRGWTRRAVAAVLLVAFAGGVWIVAQRFGFANPFTMTLELVRDPRAASARIVEADPFFFSRAGIWRASARAIADRPLLGVGPTAFPAVSRAYAFADPDGAARYAKVFDGPHSDALAALVDLGAPGGLLLLGALGWMLLRAARGVRAPDGAIVPAHAGLLAALAAFAGHALVDDLFTTRPAVALAAAAALGALGGRSTERASWRVGPRARIAVSVAVATALVSAEVIPWLADEVARQGRPSEAARIDGARSSYWAASARVVTGPAEERIGSALDRIDRARRAAPGSAEPLEERAQLLDASCRGPLSDRETCADAREAWSRVVAARPANPFALRMRARLAGLLGDLGGAEADLRGALALEPAFLGARLDLARALCDAGRVDEAREELARFDEIVGRLSGTRPRSAYEMSLLEFSRAESLSLRARVNPAAP